MYNTEQIHRTESTYKEHITPTKNIWYIRRTWNANIHQITRRQELAECRNPNKLRNTQNTNPLKQNSRQHETEHITDRTPWTKDTEHQTHRTEHGEHTSLPHKSPEHPNDTSFSGHWCQSRVWRFSSRALQGRERTYFELFIWPFWTGRMLVLRREIVLSCW